MISLLLLIALAYLICKLAGHTTAYLQSSYALSPNAFQCPQTPPLIILDNNRI
jgi:hypothetical protein